MVEVMEVVVVEEVVVVVVAVVQEAGMVRPMTSLRRSNQSARLDFTDVSMARSVSMHSHLCRAL